jgi:hypothetical protein
MLSSSLGTVRAATEVGCRQAAALACTNAAHWQGGRTSAVAHLWCRPAEVELQLWTREGPTIAGLVVEYINTIMEDRATPALPKRSLGTSASD